MAERIPSDDVVLGDVNGEVIRDTKMDTNTNNTGKPVVQETLVSDTCHDAFQGGAFEFSVAVNKVAPETDDGAREIIISANHVVEKLPPLTKQESDEKGEAMPKEHVANDGTISEQSPHSTAQVESNRDGATEQTEGGGISVETANEPTSHHETTSDVSAEPKLHLPQDVTITLETKIPDDTSDQPKAESIRAQRGPVMDRLMEAEAERLIISSPKPTSDEPHISVRLETKSEAEPETSKDKRSDSIGESKIGQEPDQILEDRAGSPTQAQSTETDKHKEKRKKYKLNSLLRRAVSLKEKETKHKEPSSHEGKHTFTDNMKEAFGNLRKGLRPKHKPPRPKTTQLVSRPPRPPPVLTGQLSFQGKVDSHVDTPEQESLQSLSGPSISSTPELPKRQLIQKAFSDFMETLPGDSVEGSHEGHASPTNLEANADLPDGSPKQEAILAWTAAQIANPPSPGLDAAVEGQIQPVHINRPRLEYHDTVNGYVAPVGSVGPSQSNGSLRGSSSKLNHAPKPPRPHSPPLLSPLDYQPFHGEEAVAQPNAAQQRLDILQSMEPKAGTLEVDVRTPNWPYEVKTGSLQHGRRNASMELSPHLQYTREHPEAIRRTQTLRTDYANRVRERVKSLRVEPGSADNSDTLHTVKVKGKKEVYACSESIKFPKFPKFKKRQPKVHKNDVSDTYEGGVIPRPQPRILPGYPSASVQRPPPLSLSAEYVTVTQTGGVHSALPPIGRPNYNLHMAPSPIESPSQPRRQLTSLRSVGAYDNYQQSTFIPEAPERGVLNPIYTNRGLPCQAELQVTSSYISGEVEKDREFDTAHKHAQQTLVCEALRQIHHILDAWESPTDETTANVESDESGKSLTRCTIQNYLNACVRLRSVDLQGQYAPLHYTLPTFDQRLWKRCAKLSNWGELQILSEPEWTTEYVNLDPFLAKEHHLLYADRAVDTMLTNWLDCHHTAPQSAETYVNTRSLSDTLRILHPIAVAIDLAEALELMSTKDCQRAELLHSCVCLAVLLSYDYLCAQTTKAASKPSDSPSDILLIVSTSNCMAVFRRRSERTSKETVKSDSAEQNAENTDKENVEEPRTDQALSDKLVQTLCPEADSVEKAIDHTIDKIYQATKDKLGQNILMPYLLKAIAPPDWIAMVMARIYLKNT